ncbi:phage tail protein I [Hafnia paralvei]|uniref:phage tail protein I n=1 Tax=Hafnia paralvei TaxID=546367 RepID=UPI003C55CE62
MNEPSLLPSGASTLERRLEQTCKGISDLQVPLRDLWNPRTCPIEFLPYLAWSRSVDRWDEHWPEETKRQVVADAFYIHSRKGTISAIRRVVEPLGYLINVSEWWENNDPAGTFRLDIGVLESGIDEAMYQEMERLIADAKPVSRHLIGLTIIQDVAGYAYTGAAVYDGDIITVYPDEES